MSDDADGTPGKGSTAGSSDGIEDVGAKEATDGVADDAVADVPAVPATDVTAYMVEAAEADAEADAGVTHADVVADADADKATVGATAGSARAAARRSGATRAGVTASKGVATRARTESEESRGSIFVRLGRFFREVVAELRKVIWPARNQMITYSIVVIVFVVFMVALVAVLDLLFAKGVLAIFG